MIQTFFEALTVIFFFTGICIYLHWLAYAVAWGWYRGKAKVRVKVFNYHGAKETFANPDTK